MGGQDRTVERIAAELGGGAHGIATRVKLLAAGVSARQIEGCLRRGALITVYPGVYRVGHAAPSVRAGYMAAVKAGGPGSVLAGLAAAWLLGLIRGGAPAPVILTPTQRRIRGVDTRRMRARCIGDLREWEGIPVTTVARTLVDLAATLEPDALARAAHEAWIRHRIGPEPVEAVLGRRPTSPGATTLRKVLRGDVHVTLSRLESQFLAVLRSARLALPMTNRLAGGRYVDCRWSSHRLTVELDSYRFHATRHAWERDRLREREAYARGDDFRRYTWDDVSSPAGLLSELRPILSHEHPA